MTNPRVNLAVEKFLGSQPKYKDCRVDLGREYFDTYVENALVVMNSNIMELPEAFELYMSYVKPTGKVITRTQVIESIKAFDFHKFSVSLSMRLFKMGLEDKDTRSVLDDFQDFEEVYLGKKAPKPFKAAYGTAKEARICLLFCYGVLNERFYKRKKVPLTCDEY